MDGSIAELKGFELKRRGELKLVKVAFVLYLIAGIDFPKSPLQGILGRLDS